ncbi:MAG: bifunctional precorrin-2 dehydrogenase/sirohydrochlorin ferrochelatase [Bacteriovoracaceae bacterium]|jgi:precorrin-2 dehydrogenase/sirohydrochlorin ferrochelatase|nr:bifunctional precorrin-2 dehydrogenase/sirohydrochlorin ferrochelatase [Bacteriovoracaceae bacterium]
MNSYFPIGLRFDNKEILLVGGGEIALFKFQKLVQFAPQKIKCIARNYRPEFYLVNNSAVELVQRDFSFDDLHEHQIVIVAIDNAELQKRIYEECKKKNILCNCVDLLECCDFIFPSLVKRGDISIAISSNGLLPGFSAILRKYIDDLLPENIEVAFKDLVNLRKSLPPGPGRMKYIREEAEKYLNNIRKDI